MECPLDGLEWRKNHNQYDKVNIYVTQPFSSRNLPTPDYTSKKDYTLSSQMVHTLTISLQFHSLTLFSLSNSHYTVSPITVWLLHSGSGLPSLVEHRMVERNFMLIIVRLSSVIIVIPKNQIIWNIMINKVTDSS